MSIPKRRLFASFWDSPPPERPARHINPKTILNNFPQSDQGQGVGEERARGGAGRARSLARQGRLCPRETHGRPWPCEWVARRHCVKSRGERQYVAKTRHERRDERRDGAKRKVSEGSSLRWRWWQRRRGTVECGEGRGAAGRWRGLSVRAWVVARGERRVGWRGTRP